MRDRRLWSQNILYRNYSESQFDFWPCIVLPEIRGKQSDSHDIHDDDIGQNKDVRRAEGIDESTLELSSGHTGILLEQRGLVQEIKLRGEPMGAGGYGQVRLKVR